MTQLIVRVIRDVLRDVIIDCFDGPHISVVASGQFGILLPEIGLEKLGCGQKAHNIYVAASGVAGAQGRTTHPAGAGDHARRLR